MNNFKRSDILQREDFKVLEPGTLLEFDAGSFVVYKNHKSQKKKYDLSRKVVLFLKYEREWKHPYFEGVKMFRLKTLFNGRIKHFTWTGVESTKFLRKIELV